MKGRLYFATKAQKEGKILIKTHPCAQIFCCDICGFEKVLLFFKSTLLGSASCAAQKVCYHWMALQSRSRQMQQQHILPLVNLGNLCEVRDAVSNGCSNFLSAGGRRTVLQRVRGKADRRVQRWEEPHLHEEAWHRLRDFPWWEDDCGVSKQQHDTEVYDCQALSSRKPCHSREQTLNSWGHIKAAEADFCSTFGHVVLFFAELWRTTVACTAVADRSSPASPPWCSHTNGGSATHPLPVTSSGQYWHYWNSVFHLKGPHSLISRT